MSEDAGQKILEHSEGHKADQFDKSLQAENGDHLPWDAPIAFRTVPTYSGPLKNPNQTAFRAETDTEAVAVWLAERASRSPNTAIAYRKEVERLLFWLADQGMSLSDTSREDYIRYAVFLLNPKPANKWINPKRVQRNHKDWKPFQAGLTSATAKQSLSICKSMLGYLHTNGWLLANTMPEPRILVKARPIERPEQVALRQVPQNLFKEMKVFARGFELDDRKDFTNWDADAIRLYKRFIQIRLSVILELAGELGARSSDLVNGRLNDIMPFHENGKSFWAWKIRSDKGKKDLIRPIPNPIMETLALMRVWIGLMPYPELGEPPCPIVPRTRDLPHQGNKVDPAKLKPIGRSGLYRHTNTFFKAFAEELKQAGRNKDGGLIDKVSTHWLRHSADN